MNRFFAGNQRACVTSHRARAKKGTYTAGWLMSHAELSDVVTMQTVETTATIVVLLALRIQDQSGGTLRLFSRLRMEPL